MIRYFRPKWLKLIPYFRPKPLKNHTLWHRPPGENALWIISLAAYTSETNISQKPVQKEELVKNVFFLLLAGRHQRVNKVTDLFFIGLLEMRLGLPNNFLRQQPCILAFFLFKTNIMQFLSFQKSDCLYYEVTSLNYLFIVLVLLHNVITLIYNIFFLGIYFYVRLILYPRATSHTYSCAVHVTLFNKV